jgi:Cys-tRNA(Pro) deacylase
VGRKNSHVSETPATQLLRRAGASFSEHPYDYVDHGGTAESARQLGVPEHQVVKTLVMQDDRAQPLIVLMHGDCQVSTKNLARAIGAKSVEPCKPEVAQRHSGYLVGGTSPFGIRKAMPVYVEETVLALPRIYINGGRRGFLVGIDPSVLVQQLAARAVSCALPGRSGPPP